MPENQTQLGRELPTYDCFVQGCDVSKIDRSEIRAHFFYTHLEYEVRYELLSLVDDSVSLLTQFGEEQDDRSVYRQARDAIDDHAVFTAEDYCENFGSITTSLFEVEALRGVDSRCPIDGPTDESGSSRMLDQRPSPPINPRPRYGPDWDDIRTSIKKRDDFDCRVCERSPAQLHVHHISPAREFMTRSRDSEHDYESMNERSNLITLCPSCHGRFEGKWVDLPPSEFVDRARDHLPDE